jgi:molybdopterin converting factor small subunit
VPPAAESKEARNMSVNVYIPTPFRHLVGNRASVSAEGGTVREVLGNLDAQFPGFNDQLLDGSGQLARHINVYVNQVEIENLQGEATPVSNGDEVAVIPALAGGAGAAMTPRNGGPPQPPPDHAAGRQRRAAQDHRIERAHHRRRRRLARRLPPAGIGKIGIVDFDVVDRSNLQRQILHVTESIGMPKVESAKARLNAHNPNVEVVPRRADHQRQRFPHHRAVRLRH